MFAKELSNLGRFHPLHLKTNGWSSLVHAMAFDNSE